MSNDGTDLLRVSGREHAARIRQALTSREQDVFSRIAAGMSNGEIATSLFLSEGTVKSMSAGYWPSSACATASKPSYSPTNPG